MIDNSFLIIPHALLTIPELNPTDKLILSEVYSLSKNTGYCYAPNRYLSKIISVTNRTVSKSIARLSELGYIKSEVMDNYQRKVYILYDKLFSKDIFYPDGEKTSIPYENTSYPTEHYSHPSEKTSIYNINYNKSNKRSYKAERKQRKRKSDASYDIEELMKIR